MLLVLLGAHHPCHVHVAAMHSVCVYCINYKGLTHFVPVPVAFGATRSPSCAIAYWLSQGPPVSRNRRTRTKLLSSCFKQGGFRMNRCHTAQAVAHALKLTSAKKTGGFVRASVRTSLTAGLYSRWVIQSSATKLMAWRNATKSESLPGSGLLLP